LKNFRRFASTEHESESRSRFHAVNDKQPSYTLDIGNWYYLPNQKTRSKRSRDDISSL